METILEKDLNELIASGAKVVVDVWMDNCPYCDQYAPIFEAFAAKHPELKFAKFNLPRISGADSTFKRNYMKPDANGSISAPATMIFEGGELKVKHYGLITEDQLAAFVATGDAPADKKKLAHQELMNLFETKGEIMTFAEKLPAINARIEEIQKLLGGK